ncbi:uncharacterized protein LOC113927850 [Zalophus californianus]|uniref:Uncharacterized protein LOC113927850 n=1 Tax=Zalophus californianus TaxID=9704 RepID=A0A6J2E112_ZALCA|nr:uncharacterized protein LOC113927850 [Zalophus californianus]
MERFCKGCVSGISRQGQSQHKETNSEKEREREIVERCSGESRSSLPRSNSSGRPPALCVSSAEVKRRERAGSVGERRRLVSAPQVDLRVRKALPAASVGRGASLVAAGSVPTRRARTKLSPPAVPTHFCSAPAAPTGRRSGTSWAGTPTPARVASRSDHSHCLVLPAVARDAYWHHRLREFIVPGDGANPEEQAVTVWIYALISLLLDALKAVHSRLRTPSFNSNNCHSLKKLPLKRVASCKAKEMIPNGNLDLRKGMKNLRNETWKVKK